MIFLMRFVVSGHSMEPSFKPGQSLFVSSIPYIFRKPKAGEVVIIKDPNNGKSLLKRITRIKDGKYFVSGDNQEDSTDSRRFGMLKKKDVLGKVIYRLTEDRLPYKAK